MVRTVETLRYITIWESHNDIRGGKTWKTDVIKAECRDIHEDKYKRAEAAIGSRKVKLEKELKQLLEAYRKKHERLIESRTALLKLYKNVSLSPFDGRWF